MSSLFQSANRSNQTGAKLTHHNNLHEVAHANYRQHNPKLRYRLHRIDIPTLLVWGENDGIVTPDYGAALRDLISGARLSVIPEAGHHPHVEQPAEFAARFLEFVSD